MTPEALTHLSRSDRVLKKVIGRIGDCQLTPQPRRSLFESLVRAIAHQQLHGKAAEAILRRFCELFPSRRFAKPAEVLRVSPAKLRAAGFSESKAVAIRDLASKTIEGIVPTTRAIEKLDDEEIIERLTQVRGVGRWTVEMLLIFQLGRPDVLPVDDFGVRNGFRLAYKRPELPKVRQLREFGERWKPFRTTAAWYLWRVADESRSAPKK